MSHITPHPATPGSLPRPAVLWGSVSLIYIFWALNFVIGKWALGHIDAVALATFRVTTAAAVLTPIFLARCKNKRIEKRDLGFVALMGLLGVAGNQVLFTIGLSRTTSGHASLVVGSGPVFVLLIACLMKLESLTWKKVAGMAACFTGVAVLALENGLSLHGGTMEGDLITLCGSLSFSGYVVVGKKIAGHYDPLAMNFYNFMIGAILTLPLTLWTAVKLDWAGVGWQGWAGMLYMALCGSVAAYLMYYWALKYLAASRLAAFSYLLPILAVTMGVLFRGEHITGQILLSGALILGGVYLTELHTTVVDEDDVLPDAVV